MSTLPSKLHCDTETMNREDLGTVVLLFIKRKPGLSFDQFCQHYREIHSPMAVRFEIFRKNVTRYEVLYVNQEWKSKLRDMGHEIPNWDAISLFQVDSVQNLVRVFTDKEFTKETTPDALIFVDFQNIAYRSFRVVPIINDRGLENQRETTGDVKSSGIPRKIQTLDARLVQNMLKKDDVTLSDFDRYWSEDYSRVIRSTPGVEGKVRSYEQLHLDRGGSNELTDHLGWKRMSDGQTNGFNFFQGSSLEEMYDTIFKNPASRTATGEEARKFIRANTSLQLLPVDVNKFI
ncbi:hypothetical protein L218DRAFT_1080566 [Marasmius fiardii PR-910]|nr:hypothetical protein L218DRAFT_1080566 [Marasmius fiardii PR-910]